MILPEANVTIFELFGELDQVIMRQFGDLDAALATEQGQQVFQQLLADENREALRAWYSRVRGRPLNSLAEEIKERIERELGQAFWRSTTL